MKNKFLKYCTAVLFLCTSTIMFAQPGSGSDNGGIDDNGSGDSTPAAPINDYVGILALVGMSYVLFKAQSSQKKEKVS